jgi:hypothetical protein
MIGHSGTKIAGASGSDCADNSEQILGASSAVKVETGVSYPRDMKSKLQVRNNKQVIASLSSMKKEKKSASTASTQPTINSRGRRRKSRLSQGNYDKAENKWKWYKQSIKTMANNICNEEYQLSALTADRKSAPAVSRAEAARQLLGLQEVQQCSQRIHRLKRNIRNRLVELTKENANDTQWPQLMDNCDEADDMVDLSEVMCSVCNQADCEENDILLCDNYGCCRAYHQNCVWPPVTEEEMVQADDWHCRVCSCLEECLQVLRRYEYCDEKLEDPNKLFPEAYDNDGENVKIEGDDSKNGMTFMEKLLENCNTSTEDASDSEEDADYVPKKLKCVPSSVASALSQSEQLENSSCSSSSMRSPENGKDDDSGDEGSGSGSDNGSGDDDSSSCCESEDLSSVSDSDSEIDKEELQGLMTEALEDQTVQHMHDNFARQLRGRSARGSSSASPSTANFLEPQQGRDDPNFVPEVSRTRVLRSQRRTNITEPNGMKSSNIEAHRSSSWESRDWDENFQFDANSSGLGCEFVDDSDSEQLASIHLDGPGDIGKVVAKIQNNGYRVREGTAAVTGVIVGLLHGFKIYTAHGITSVNAEGSATPSGCLRKPEVSYSSLGSSVEATSLSTVDMASLKASFGQYCGEILDDDDDNASVPESQEIQEKGKEVDTIGDVGLQDTIDYNSNDCSALWAVQFDDEESVGTEKELPGSESFDNKSNNSNSLWLLDVHAIR